MTFDAGRETTAPSVAVAAASSGPGLVPRAGVLRIVSLVGPFVIAIVAGGVILAATGRDALGTYGLLLEQALGSQLAIGNTLAAATPVLLTGLATSIAFRAGVFNIGVEGSLYVGAFAAAWAGFSLLALPAPLLIVAATVLGALAGAAWAFVPGILRARWRVDEVVTTLMLNYVAILLTSFLVNRLFLAPDIANSMSPLISPDAQLGSILPPSQVTIAFPLGLVLVLGAWAMFRYTALGYQLRLVGLNPRFSRMAGIDLVRTILSAMLISGAIGGIAGGLQILGVNYRFIDHFSPGYGFTGIAVALLGRGHPVGLVLAALFFGGLTSGGATIQLFTDIPLDLVKILQGVVMIFAVIDLSRLVWAARTARA